MSGSGIQFNKDRQRALSELLVSECRSDSYTLESVTAIIDSGADINYQNSRPLYFATKRFKFDLIELLVRRGAKIDGIGKSYIASMCDYKGFNDLMEQSFFNTLDLVYSKDGNYMELFTPYINACAVNGKIDKLLALMKRYFLTEAEIANAIYIRIIFEIINGGFDKMLSFIERHKAWMDKASLDLAVTTNEWQVLEHFVLNGKYQEPSEQAVAQNVFSGNFETLIILKSAGYSFSGKPLLVQKAIDAARIKDTRALEFLLENGVRWTDKIKGKELKSIAVLEGGALAQLLARHTLN